jgi:uncharacterized protein
MRAATLAAALLVAPSLWADQAQPASSHAPAAPPNMESYQLVLLVRPTNAPKLPDAELEKLQAAHIGHLKKMAAAGKLLVAGPLDDQPDPSLRGICLYRAGSLAEARALAEEDPSVKAGRLRVEVMTWWTEKGALAFPIAQKMAQPTAPQSTPQPQPAHAPSQPR